MTTREQEIRLQFLEEAQDYLQTIESGLIGLSGNGMQKSHLDALLRAAHSLKGGSAMMGFHALSEFSHRLEDFFKVLKVGKKQNGGKELESLFLSGVDGLREAIAFYRQGKVIEQSELETTLLDIFEQLHAQLGDPQPEDNAALLADETGEDMSVFLFETEVEGCLQRLESVLANPDSPCLREEFLITAQELEGLGEMLELEAFSQLCGSIAQKIETAPSEKLVSLSEKALKAWRKSQAMVIVGQHNTLPTQLDSPSEPISEPLNAITENTIRVPVRQLEQLSDLFGELTIERNGLDLQLKSLHNLVHLLSQRVHTLEQSNFRLRATYDQVATQSSLTPQLVKSGISHSPTHEFDLLEMDQYNDVHLLSQEVMETVVQIQEVTTDLEVQLSETERTARELNRTAKVMQTRMTQVRMRPISDILARFPRALRDLTLQYGKPVELRIRGGSTLIDRTILEALNEPLLHLLRNAFDHGIEDIATRRTAGKPEQGLIEISAAYRGNKTVITIQDDGAGLNLDKIRARVEQLGYSLPSSRNELLNYIFEPGFSTTEQVTDLSGRGVGMDVVRTNLQQVQGEVRVDTQAGVGTTFTITVPFNLSVMRVLLVESEGMLLAFPTNAVEEMLLLQPENILASAGQEVLNWEGYMMPLIRLSQWLRFGQSPPRRESEDVPKVNAPTVLVIAQGESLVGIQVNCYWGEQEVTIRQVEGKLKMPPGFAGCTILGDGRVVPLINPFELLEWMSSHGNESSSVVNIPIVEAPSNTKHSIMVVDDSINVRRFLAFTLEKAGYRVEQAKDGQEALEKLHAGLSVQAIICDIEMPRLDGYGFLVRVKGEPLYAQIPVVMLTSRSGDKHRQAAMNLGATAYFSKPFKENLLLQTLQELILQ